MKPWKDTIEIDVKVSDGVSGYVRRATAMIFAAVFFAAFAGAAAWHAAAGWRGE
jgi:hypothetical protein